MTIRNHEGQPFDLQADVHIELIRPNPFFSDLAGHSMPIRLPETPTNRRLLSRPDLPGNMPAVGSRMDVSIEDGGFVFRAVMVLRAYSPDEGYDCNFLLSDGSLYDRMRPLTLDRVMAAHRTTGSAACVVGGWRFASMDEAINFAGGVSNSPTLGVLAIFPAMLVAVTPDDNNSK